MPKSDGENKRAARPGARLEEQLHRMRAEATPAIRALKTAPVALPDVTAPSLDDLVVRLEEPPPITADDLLRRFTDRLRGIAKKRERAPGEPCTLGDDVVLDTLGYAEGMLLPFSVKRELRTELTELPWLPGLAEAIAGMKVGEGRVVSLAFPADYPVERWRGVPVRVIVDLHAAVEVALPEPTAASTFAALGLGDSLAEVMAALREELDAELGEAMLVDAQARVLDEVARRVQVAVPPAAVDEEITRRWGALEGGVLAKKGFSPAEQDEALALWKQDPEMRVDAEHRIKVALALKAIAARDGIEVTRDDVQGLLGLAADVAGVGVDEASRALKEDRPDAARIIDVATHLKVVEHVMAKARFVFPEDAA